MELGRIDKIRIAVRDGTAEDLDEVTDLLAAAFGPAGATAATRLRRPRVAHNVAVYHRTRPAA